MASLNKVVLLGNLTRDPELRYTPNGVAVASFGLAVNRRYQQAEEWKEEVCFIDIVVFGRQAQPVSEYLSKGSQALVEGHLRWRSWEGQDGQKRSKHEIMAERVQFMSRTRDDGMERTGGGMERAGGGMERQGGGMERAGGGMERAGGGMERAGGGMERAGGGMERAGGGMERAGGGMERQGGGMERSPGGMQRSPGGMGTARDLDDMDFPPPEDDIPF